MQSAGLRSIRWQLPLTYAGIALVAVVALSAILIGLLRQFYAQQEFQMLESGSARMVQSLGTRLDQPLNVELVPTLIGGMRFAPDYRIELLDPNGLPVFDTGIVNTFTVSFTDRDDIIAVTGEAAAVPLTASSGTNLRSTTVYGPITAEEAALLPPRDAVLRHGVIPVPIRSIRASPVFAADMITSPGALSYWGSAQPAAGDVFVYNEDVPFGTTLAVGSGDALVLTDASTASIALRERTSATMTRDIRNSMGDIIGYVRLSNPPAIGSAIIESVTNGAIVAGAGAVLIAALLGWWVSQRLTRPLLALTDATSRMASGDLSARVDVPRMDELGKLAASFNAMAAKVEQTIAALRRFAADAAHELHTPLTAIKTNLELAQERPDLARLREAVAQLERLEVLADDLLDLSRLEVAEPPRTSPVDVGALVREVSEVYASRAEQAGIEFELAMAGTLPKVRANATLLRRALSNLLDNAVKFTPSGGDVLLATSADDGTLQFIVEDSGIGIPSGDLPALFSRFHRGSNTSGYPGSGLGLAIVKAIADVHQGTVTAERTPRGARFVLKVPVTV